ncbi:ATP-dependent DNA helicase PcrA [bacterium]|nr:MAG: ATP-dependent DNA helicase PcrA [bacterium]
MFVLVGLNPQQREAVLHPEGPELVIAGAGTGKTRVLTTRIAWLIEEQGVQPEEILAFTFTNKAAREMQDRVHRMVPHAAGRSWIGTFHATGVRLLRREGSRLGYDRWFTIFDSDDSRSLIKRILKRINADPKQLSPRAVASAISTFKNSSLTPEAASNEAVSRFEEKVAEAYGLYVTELKSMGAMDFDDLICNTVQLLEEHQDIQERYARQFRHVLVDEFQDTNPQQLVMVKALSAVHQNLCAVGDDDQSIYSWRGATVENMLNFEEYFPGAQVIRLEQNYRSTPVVLRAANEVIAHNRRRKGKNLWSDRSGGPPLELWWSEDEEDEAAQVRDRIRRLLAETDASRKHIVILYRTNAQSRALEDALRRESIPYQIIGGTRFYERREVRDLLAYLKVILNPADRVSLARILNVPRRGLGKTTSERFFTELELRGGSALNLLGDKAALAATCGNAPGKRLARFGETLKLLRRLAENSDAAAVLRQLVKAVEYEDFLEKDDPITADERRNNVAELVNAAHEFTSESDDPSLGAFLESVALLADGDRVRDTTDVVTLMTVHTAKGLEYPYVFITGCEDGLLPHASSIEEDDAVEEERRLFYVALTRAQEQVFLTSASMRRRYGSMESCIPSRFLGELPEDCVAEMTLQPTSLFGGPRLTEPRRPRPEFGEGAPRKHKRRDTPVSTDVMADAAAFLKSKARQKAADRSGHGFSDHDVDQSPEMSYHVGMRVEHEMLGIGIIEEVEGIGELMRLTVSFGEDGRKRLLARFARLRVLDSAAD